MGKIIDLTGQQFHYWTVKSFAYIKNTQAYWNCICKCGTKKTIRGSALRSGRSKSCGCLLTEMNSLKILGKKFGSLYVEKQLSSKNWKSLWLCKCDCGNYCEKYGKDLTSGKATNCGCIGKLHWQENGKKNFKDLTGQKIGLLFVEKRIEDKIYNGKKYTNYSCLCDCGNRVEITGSALSRGFNF